MLRLFLLVAAIGVLQLQGALAQYEPVRGAKMRVEVKVGDVRLEITAAGFYERAGGQAPRELFATQIHATAVGSAAAEFDAIRLGESWLEKNKLEASYDQSLDVSLATDGVGLQWAAENSPIQFRIYPESVSPPARPRGELRIRGTALDLSEIEGASATVTAGSRITETRAQRIMDKGEMITRPLPPKPGPEHFADFDIQIGAAEKNATHTHRRHQTPPLVFIDNSGRPLEVLSENRIIFTGSASVVSAPVDETDYARGFGETPIEVSWALNAGAPLDLGTVGFAGGNAEKWIPTLGGDQFVVVKLKDPTQVEAVRFVLANVSQHPGIAINANVGAVDSNARQLTPAPVKVTAGSISWTRFYQTYAATIEDTRPDLIFDLEKNPGMSYEGTNLTQIRADQVSKEISAKVTARDWAASGQVRAQIKVDGIWEDLPATGPAAADDKISLQLPIDDNKNGIADAWETNLGSDDDRDGLMAFDEYRGAYINGKHTRLDTQKHDAFVLDYTTRSKDAIKQLADEVADDGVVLHVINGAEHRAELIGQAQLVVLEELRENALPALLPSNNPKQAWTALQPSPDFRTLFLNGPADRQLLARDLRQILELKPKAEVAESP